MQRGAERAANIRSGTRPALPVRRSERELKRFLAGAPGNILVRYRDPQSLGARIKVYLRSLKPERWPDLDALSGHFYMAPSTLRRKLAGEGKEAARLFAEHEIPWEEIAFRTVKETLEQYFADRERGAFGVHTLDVR